MANARKSGCRPTEQRRVVLVADNAGRLDLQYYSLLTRASVSVLVNASVLLRHLIDVFLSHASGQLINHLPADHN